MSAKMNAKLNIAVIVLCFRNFIVIFFKGRCKMIQIGRGGLWHNSYKNEIEFCKKNDFDFIQIWFKDGELLVNDIPAPKEAFLKKAGFPIIIHALFELDDFKRYGNQLLNLVTYLGEHEVIIHPVCKKKAVIRNTEYELAEHAVAFSAKARAGGITWYLENNSVLDVFHYQKTDLEIVYRTDPYVEALLDIAHIDNYQHLQDLIDVKFPKCLHAAGKHFAVPHEHLPLTCGDIDYRLVFRKYLHGYQGRIILEVDGSGEEMAASRRILAEALLYA